MEKDKTGTVTTKVDTKVDTKPATDTSIPKERLDAVLGEKKQLESQLSLMQNQLEIMKSNMTTSAQQQPKAQPVNLFEGIFDADETVAEKKHLEKFGAKLLEALRGELGGITSQIGILSAKIDNPDGDSILNDHFLNVAKANPKVLEIAKRLAGIDPGAANLFAIEMAKTDPAYLEKQTKKNSVQSDIETQIADLKAQLENKSRPLGMGGAGGTGVGGGKLSQILHEIVSLSTDEFLKRQEALKSGAEKLPNDTA
jgi:hypothetical protein